MSARQHPFAMHCLALLWPLLAFGTTAQAGVVIHGTRIVFPGTDNEVTVQMNNEGQRPELVQLWLEPEHGLPESALEASDRTQDGGSAFVLSPAVFRIEPGKGQTVRIIRSRKALAPDKESLFWFNLREIPHKSKASDAATGSLHFALTTRIRLMYRPPGLPGSAVQAPEQLKWSLATDKTGQALLHATNPSAYVVNLGGVDLKMGTHSFEAGSGHIPPGGSATFAVEGAGAHSLAGATVVFNSLNDWGGARRHEARLSP